jgi:ribulose-phosphate 3-epimerase
MTSSALIYPGVVAPTHEEFEARLAEIRAFSHHVHIDIADGVYALNVLQISDIEPFSDITAEAHLMVQNPQDYFEMCVLKGIQRVVVHSDTLGDSSYSAALRVQGAVQRLGLDFTLAFRRGILPPLNDDLKKFNRVLIMTVDLGFAGAPFLEEQIDVIRSVHAYAPELQIEVDGHVTDTTLPLLREAGATVFVSTSYLSGPTAYERYLTLQELLS